MGVTVRIILAHADHAILRIHLVQEAIARRGIGTVMSHLQHIHVPIHSAAPVIQHIVFCRNLHISGEQEGGFAVNHLQNNGGIIGICIGLGGSQHGNLCPAQRHRVSRLGKNNLLALLVRVVYEIIKAAGGIGFCGGINCLGGIHCQYRGQTAHMILMGMGANHRFQFLHTLLLQVRDHQLTVIHIAAVYDHKFAAALQKRTVCLPHIQKMHHQPIAGNRCSRWL